MEKELEKVVEKAKKDEDVLAVMLFGSYARGEAKPDSDIDVCLVLSKKFKGDFTEKKLEYLSELPSKFDIHIFQQMPLYIRIRVLREGKILLDKNYDELVWLAIRTIKDFDLFEKHYYACIKGVAQNE